ncbi:MAG: HAD-IIA family hydrolase [Sporolactobacillus sp.]|jgi:phosphoglycolate/pyridoxal phosphate phosphatase family enzyme|nr:HAD-IIA family hydrolase [Sporolactobacillus sp.]MCI1882181.1 HAD-IIA family hydrolase [Sporolactobacillus sp.]
MIQVADIDWVLFDLDGTLYEGNQLLPGVIDLIRALHRSGKAIRFVSNTSIFTRRQCALKLNRMGVSARIEEVMTSSYAAAIFASRWLQNPKLWVVGERALIDELAVHGITIAQHASEATHVLVGLDRLFTFEKLTDAMHVLQQGAPLIITNPDAFFITETGTVPDTLGLALAIKTAGNAKHTIVIGKPADFFFRIIEAENGSLLEPNRCLMVGDRLDTDIVFGKKIGMKTVLALTGVSTVTDCSIQSVFPDYIVHDLRELVVL